MKGAEKGGKSSDAQSEYRRGLAVGALFAVSVLTLAGCGEVVRFGVHAGGHAAPHAARHVSHEVYQNMDSGDDGVPNRNAAYPSDPRYH